MLHEMDVFVVACDGGCVERIGEPWAVGDEYA